MNPFLWLLWVAAALILLVFFAAILLALVKAYRDLPPKRAQHSNHVHWGTDDAPDPGPAAKQYDDGSFIPPGLTYGDAIDQAKRAQTKD